MNKLKVEFEQKILESKATFSLSQSQSAHEIDLKIKDLEQAQKLEIDLKQKEIEDTYRSRLAELGVDINKYEIQLAKSNSKIDKLYDLAN